MTRDVQRTVEMFEEIGPRGRTLVSLSVTNGNLDRMRLHINPTGSYSGSVILEGLEIIQGLSDSLDRLLREARRGL